MGWKDKITGPEQTTGTQFGGITLNAVLDYFSAFDHTVAGTIPTNAVDIATETIFASNVLKFWDSNKSHKITIQLPDYTENKTWTFPSEAEMGATDQVVFKDTVQILTGKTLNFASSNTAQNIPKTALAAPAVFTDQDNTLGAHYLGLANFGPSGNPPAGTRWLHVNPSDGKISVKRPDGIIVSLEEGSPASAGGFAGGGSTTRNGDGTTKIFTIAHGQPQPPDIPVVIPTSVDANADRKVTVDGTNVIIEYNVAPPTGTNNLGFIWGVGYVNPSALVFHATSITTMTNKTVNVDQNIVKHSTTNAAGDLLKGNATQFIRWAKGTAYQLIRVNSGATDIEYASPSSIFNDYIDFVKISPPADPGAEAGREYFKEIDANNNTVAVKQQINGAIVEVLAF